VCALTLELIGEERAVDPCPGELGLDLLGVAAVGRQSSPTVRCSANAFNVLSGIVLSRSIKSIGGRRRTSDTSPSVR
jgi:hypothetical protein